MKSTLAKFVIISLMAIGFSSSAIAQIDSKQFSDAMKKYLDTPEGQQAIGENVEGFFKKKQQEMQRKQAEAEQKAFEEQFKNPVKIEIGNSPVKGPANAKITVVEFSDFQCPYCKRGKDTMDELLKAYPKDVKLTFKNLPLPFHKEAMPAAKAALAAGKQGKFWEMHDALFDNQSKLGAEFYTTKAKELGLNVEKFKADMASPEIEASIKEDQALANKNGIQGTPGFFVGGVAVKGAYPIDHFKMIVDRLLTAPATK